MKRRASVFCALPILFAITQASFAQVKTLQVSTGTPPFSSQGGGPFDAVNLGNLNVHFSVPVLHKAGRGIPFTYDLSYNSSIWAPVTTSGTTAWTPVANWGWAGSTQPGTGWVSYDEIDTFPQQNCQLSTYTNYVYHDAFGSAHPFPGKATWQFGIGGHSCTSIFRGLTVYSSDGSGYYLNINNQTGVGTLTAKDGSAVAAPFSQDSGGSGGPGSITNSNGNKITVNTSGQFFDTLSSTTPVLTVAGSGTPSSPITLTYVAPSGANAAYKVNYTAYTVQTAFGYTGDSSPIGEYRSTSAVNLVTSIALPDDTTPQPDRYTFTYEATTGSCTLLPGTSQCVTARIASATLPTGGTITYTYSGGTHNTGIYSDGSTGGLTRMLSPTSSCTPNGCWQYVRALVSGTPGPGSTWTATITDPTPQQNVTVVNFAEDSTITNSGANPPTTATYNFYETQRKVYQGSISTSNLLATTIRCYNGVYTTCAADTVSSPIYSSVIYSQLPNGMTRASVISYGGSFPASGLVSSVSEYDYGVTLESAPSSTFLVRGTATTYASLTNGIINRPAQVTVTGWTNGTGGVTVASTTYTYDQGTPTAPTGATPQHIPITGSRGNVTTVAKQVSGTISLYRRLTYYDTGEVNTATDAGTTSSGGPNVTTYNYPDATSTCGNAFPASITEPLGLPHPSFTWDCTGGVMKTATDENGKTVTTYYTGANYGKSADPNFWRPYAATDQLSNPTTFSYPSVRVAESTMGFNGTTPASVVDHRTTLDIFGRPIIEQTEQGYNSTNYDSVETDYDALGRPVNSTRPYSAVAGALCSGTCPGATAAYDALNRPTTVTDPGGGTINTTYTNNDVLQVVGPAPPWDSENTKQKQFEYDGLGRLTSVCELTAAGNGGGSCAQASAQTGFWTKYANDWFGHITGVTQNAQAASGSQQARTYAFDMIGRLTSETNPETGTVNYTYDTSDSTCGSYASAGDLVEKKDAMSNYTCFKYDGLHRVTQISYPSGTYASTTPTKCFVYDSATVNGNAVANAKTRLAEAYTSSASSCPGTKTVDEGFSYSARGEVADVWESTPNSGGYYHVNASYWANGTLDVLNGGATPLPGLPAITYGASDGSGLDGEGRVTKVNAASGQNPVTSVGYNVSSQVTAVTLGSLDNDVYQYDPSTGRTTQYQFNMGASPNTKTQTGALTWNQNGTLKQLQITDQINIGNSQTCTFGYDDLVRINSTNCASAWSQTFAFDPFGNLKKSGAAQFLPTYTGEGGAGSPTNRYFSIPGGSVSYDGNGNLTNDVTHTYTWDADGNNLSVDGSAVTMIYDAQDRMIEQTRGSSHQQIVYGPYGMKLALMNGQMLANAFVKLPGGAGAVYNGSGLAYYRHSDHLGSSRLSTTTSRTKYYDVAYAPYGEEYNGSGTTQDLAFTDQNQDTVSGGWTTNLYDFMSREYRTGHGRWTSPDPGGLGVANPASPQSWNRYAYVANNPLSFVDPLGLVRAYPGQCQGGEGECPWEGGGMSPTSIGGGGFSIPLILQVDHYGWIPITPDTPGFQPIPRVENIAYWGVISTDFISFASGNAGGETTDQGGDGTCGTSVLPRSAGISYGGSVDAGSGYEGASATGSGGIGVFANSNTGPSVGSFASGGATAYFFNGNVGAPKQQGQPFTFGGYAGAGPSVWISNAGGAPQLGGPFTTLSLNVGAGPARFSAQLSYAGGIWQLSIGPPIPFVSAGTPSISVSKLTTKTTTTSGCH